MSRQWLRQSERTTPLMLYAMRWIALNLGRGLAKAVLYPGTLYFLATGRGGRRASRDFLSRVFGRRASLLEVYRHQRTFATTVMDRVLFLTGRYDRFQIEVHGREEVLALESVRQGGGVLLLGSHLGSFEVLRSLAVAKRNLPIKVLMHRAHNERITRLLDALNIDVADTVIPMGRPDTMLRAKEWTDAGGFLGLLGDRVDAGAKVVRCRFFDRPVNLPAGPMLLASVLKVPVVLFFGLYHGGNRYSIHFEILAEQIDLPRSEREARLAEWTQRYAERLEYYARKAPYNWFNFYDYWDDHSSA
jgi:predicted LPLAT superfamily acyltransferase